MSIPGRPVGCFLFLGPTGTGKTRLVEAAAESAAGDARVLIKIDCGEFQHSHEIAKLTGSPPGYLGHRDTHPLLSQEALNRFHTQDLKLSFVLFDPLGDARRAVPELAPRRPARGPPRIEALLRRRPKDGVAVVGVDGGVQDRTPTRNR